MDEKPIEERPAQPGKATMIGLILAFLPAGFLLLAASISRGNVNKGFFSFACVVSVICCFTSSFMLFRRNTIWSVLLGVLFLLLNLLIAFFLGCVASLS